MRIPGGPARKNGTPRLEEAAPQKLEDSKMRRPLRDEYDFIVLGEKLTVRASQLLREARENSVAATSVTLDG
jgi:hypothetical protein